MQYLLLDEVESGVSLMYVWLLAGESYVELLWPT
jgi:hypothetical protein